MKDRGEDPRRKAPASAKPSPVLELTAPRDLSVLRFELAEGQYAIFEFPTPEVNVPQGLSQAEDSVVRAILAGKSNAVIARERGTSPRTVANQLQSIYRKLKLSGRKALIHSCHRSPASSK